MENKKLFVLVTDCVIDDDMTSNVDVRLFNTRADAVAALKEDYANADSDLPSDWIREEPDSYPWTASIFDDGYYNGNHVTWVIRETGIEK